MTRLVLLALRTFSSNDWTEEVQAEDIRVATILYIPLEWSGNCGFSQVVEQIIFCKLITINVISK